MIISFSAIALNSWTGMKIPGLNFSILSNHYVGAISMAQLIRILGRSQAWVFIPLYLSNVRHIPYVYVGVLFFLTAMATLPFSIYGGNLIDRIGRRFAAIWLPPIIIALLMAMTLAVYLHLPDFILYISFILIEPFSSIQGILDNVVLTDTTSESERTDAFSMIRIGGNVGFALGPAIGGFLSVINYSLVFLFPAIASVGEWYLYYRYVHETRPAESESKEKMQIPISDKPFILLCFLIASVWFIAGQWGTTLTLFWSNVDKISNSFIGILYAINGLVVVFLQIPTNWLLARMKDYRRIALGGLIYAFSFFALVFSRNILFLAIDVVFITMAENVLSPVAYSVVGKMAPSDKRGQYYGAFQLIMGLIMPVAPIIGTILLTRYSSDPLYMWGPLMLLGVALSLTVLKFGGNTLVQDRREPTQTKIG